MKIKNFIRTWFTRIVFPDLYNWVLNVNQLSKEVRELKDSLSEYATQADLDKESDERSGEDNDLSNEIYDLTSDVEDLESKLNTVDNLIDCSTNMQEAITIIANKLNISKEIAEILSN